MRGPAIASPHPSKAIPGFMPNLCAISPLSSMCSFPLKGFVSGGSLNLEDADMLRTANKRS